jgi:hypothetical protein
MATIGDNYPTLLDMANALNPNGTIAEVAEMLSKVNPILDHIPWKEANDGTTHKVTSRTFLPTPKWRRHNEGILPSKSRKETGREVCGMMADYSKVDCALARRARDPKAFRKSEDDAKIAGFNLELARSIFYESAASNPERITGLAPRFASTSGIAGSQIVKADPTASGNDQTSIWLIGWGPQTVYGIYPQNSIGGMDIRDMGERPVQDPNGVTGAEFQAYVTYFEWQCGLVVHDWRYVSRIANIDTSAWKADLSAGADLVLAMDDAITALQETTTVRPVFYMNRQTQGMLNKQLKKREGSFLQWLTTTGGRRLAHYNDIPIVVVDAISNAESVVS